jgi:hypothetical protein
MKWETKIAGAINRNKNENVTSFRRSFLDVGSNE